ncbi:MAG TPA: hypothetical protein ENI14_03065, partial [Thermoplasmatales archaeon]|nr:hypothetical protein [Thermoplasmatales archaeon]
MMFKIKQAAILFVILLLLSSFTYSHGKISNFLYLEEIKIPVDTSDQNSRYYPIDIRVNFDHPCWARDEINRSVRVFVYHDGEYREIESQIYNLEFVDNSHIRSCNLVFLIPDFADGREKYFVAYSDKPTPAPDYEDHVSLREGRFYYEPIKGYKADVRYYLIKEDGYAPFLVCYDGSVTGLRFAQRIVKLKERSKDISLHNWLVATTYALMYLDETRSVGSVGSMERFRSKKIFVDGNLMIRFGIETESFDGNLLTRNVYTYYYSPIGDKRIVVSSYQKIKENRVSTGTGAQGGNIVTMITSITRSANIEELNTGLFIPYVHFFSEENIVKEYKFPQDVSGARRKWIILPEDDEDLGEKPWISMDFGDKGDTFALIFTNTSLFSKGREGLQVTAGLSKWIDMPGLLMQGMGISVGRNSYEKGEEEILELPSNLETSFLSEFYYTKDGYFKIKDEVDRFARTFSSTYEKGDWNYSKNNRKKTYNLTVIPSLQGLSYPLIAAVSRFPIPIVTIELYKDGRIVSSALFRRYTLIKFRELPENLRDIKNYLYLDVKNISIFQKVKFPGLEEGNYVVKVYFKFGKIKKFIGLEIVDLSRDRVCMVLCKPEVRLRYSVKDQYGGSIENVSLNVIKDGEIVENYISDKDGKIEIRLPLSDYKIEAFYKDLKLFSDEIKAKDFLLMLRLHRDKKINLYNLNVKTVDTLGLPFGDDLYLDLNGIKADFSDGNHIFTRIPEGSYKLRLLYKSFEYELQINLNDDTETIIEIPVSYDITLQVKDLLD